MVPPAGNPVVSATTISSTVHNNTVDDVADEVTNSIPRDGQAPPTANLPMGGFKHTGVAVAAATTDYLRADQGQNSVLEYAATVGGTANAITLTLSPVPAAYAAGQTFRFIAASANTAATTVNVNSLGVKSITKNGTTALAAGDIKASSITEITYDGTQFQLKQMAGQANTVANAMLAQMVQATVKGRAAAAGTGDPTDLTSSQLATLIGGYFLSAVTRLTATGTYTVPAGVRALKVTLIGGGGGGGGSDAVVGAAAAGGGGGGGALLEFFVTSLAASYDYVIGAGGTGGNAAGNSGTAGSSTTFNSGNSLARGGGLGNGALAGGTQVRLERCGGMALAGTSTIGTILRNETVVFGLAGRITLFSNLDATATIDAVEGGGGGGRGGGLGGVNAAGTAGDTNTGGGGGGSSTFNTTTGSAGGAGGSGVIYIEEYV